MHKSMKIIGFDPASHRNLGWALIEYEHKEIIRCESGTCTFPAKKELWRFLGPMSITVDQLLAEQAPDFVVIEQTSAFRGGFVTGQVSYCIGVLLAICSRLKIDVGFVFPTHVKKVLTGKGRATKVQVRKSVKSLLEHLGISIEFGSDHAIDALGGILVWLIDKKEINYV